MSMVINPMAAATQLLPALSGTGTGAAATSASGLSAAPAPFADLFTDAVSQVNQLETQAQAAVDGLMTGTGVDVHRR